MNLTIDVFQGIEPWVFTNGGQVLNNTWTSCVINNPAAVEACTFARSLVAKKLAPSPGGTFNQFSALGQGTSGDDGSRHLALELLRRKRRGQRPGDRPVAEEGPAGLPCRSRFFPDPRSLEVQG